MFPEWTVREWLLGLDSPTRQPNRYESPNGLFNAGFDDTRACRRHAPPEPKEPSDSANEVRLEDKRAKILLDLFKDFGSSGSIRTCSRGREASAAA